MIKLIGKRPRLWELILLMLGLISVRKIKIRKFQLIKKIRECGL